jgi:hypothetical protein
MYTLGETNLVEVEYKIKFAHIVKKCICIERKKVSRVIGTLRFFVYVPRISTKR